MQMKNKLVLNKELYSYSYIGQAIMVYKRLTDISVIEDEKYWICEFDNRTKKEFENYLIQLWNQGRGM